MARALPTAARRQARTRLGVVLSSARRRLRLSQELVAAELGVTRQTLVAWEQGVSEPEGLDLLHLIERLELDLVELKQVQ